MIELEDPCLEKGDRVEIEIPDRELVKVSLIFYLIPTGAFILGLLLGWMFLPEEWGSLVTGGIFLLFSSLMVRFYSRRKTPGLRIKKV